jgi:hypothetical protein
MSPNAGPQPMSTAVQYTGAQLNFGDLTPYLTMLLQVSSRVEKCLLLTMPVNLVSLVSTWIQFSLCRMCDMEIRLARIDYKTWTLWCTSLTVRPKFMSHQSFYTRDHTPTRRKKMICEPLLFWIFLGHDLLVILHGSRVTPNKFICRWTHDNKIII